jgi:hypothetical protein
MSDNKEPEKSSAKCRDGEKTAVATVVSEKTTDKGSCSTTCGPAADSSGEQASSSSSSSGGQVGQRKGCHRPKSKAFFYKDTVEHSSSGGESDSSCPKVKDYPVGRDQFTRRSPTSKELEEAWQGSRKEEAAIAAATGQSDANRRESWSSSPELSSDHYFWEPDEEDLVLEDLRSRFESDR